MSIQISNFPWTFQNLYAYRDSPGLRQIFSLYAIVKYWVIDCFLEFIDGDAYGSPVLLAVLGIVLVLIFAACFSPIFMPCPSEENSHHARTVLQALQTVLVPTCSLWPARYIQLVQHASINPDHGSRSKIVIPLSMLMQDVCDGVIELRDPVSDLEDLMDGGVSAYGCFVSLSIDWNCWVEWLDRMLQGDNSYSGKRCDAVGSSYLPTGTQMVRQLTPASSPLLDRKSIDLNNKPLKTLASVQLPRGSRATLEFTCLSSSILVLSTTHVLCMIPFMAHRLPHRLSDVLAAVGDTPYFKLSSLTNSSATYAMTLAAASSTITDDPKARELCVDKVGIKGWRERRLVLAFEAALVRKGWLEHWEVVLDAS